MIRTSVVESTGSSFDFDSADVFVVNSGGSRPPVVQVLTWDTEADDVPKLLAELPSDQPVYVICPPTADDPYDFPRTVAAWVEHVRERLVALELDDDAVYVGWSFGGVVALEVAQAIQDEAGTNGAIDVLMIDSRNPIWTRDRTKAVSKPHAVTRLLTEMLERPRADRTAFVKRRIADFRENQKDDEPRDEMSPLLRAILVAWFKYEPRHYNVSGTLLWCDDSRVRVGDASLGWASWWDGPFRFERVGANHFEVYNRPMRTAIAGEIVRLTERTQPVKN